MRFVAKDHPAGVLLLDTWTGAVALVRADGRLEQLRDATADAGEVLRALQGGSPGRLEGSRLATPKEVTIALPADTTALDHEVVGSFPYPIASAWRMFLVERDPRLRCRLLVDAFTQALKYTALVAASDYLQAEEVRDPAVNDLLARDLQRPLLSAWSQLLLRVFPAMHDAGVEPFMPELGAAYEALETKCRRKVAVSVPVEDAEGRRSVKVSQLPALTALIKFRNTLAHGTALVADRAEEALATYGPVMRDVLTELRFLTRYPLLLRQADGVRRLMGTRPPDAPLPASGSPGQPAGTLLVQREQDGRTLPLFVLFDVGGEQEALPGVGGDVLLWEGTTKTALLYLSAAGEHVEKRGRLEAWRTLLAAKALEVRVLTRATLTLEALRAAAARTTSATLEALVSSGKYLREVAAERPDVSELLEQCDRGDWRGLLLGGESGIGKSTLLAQSVDRWLAAGDVVVFHRASALADPDLARRVVRDLGLRDLFFEELLEAARPCFSDTAARLRIVIDGLNEHAELPSLCRCLDDMAEQAAAHSWVRLYASIRSSAWERLPAADRIGSRAGARWLTVTEERGGQTTSTSLVRLLPLRSDEELRHLYERYRAYRHRAAGDPLDAGIAPFRPSTPWESLDPAGSTRALFRSPLMLRLVLAAHNRRPLPSHLTSDDAMRLFLAHVVVEEETAPPRRDRLDFLRALVRLLDHRAVDQVERDELFDVPQLRGGMLPAGGRQAVYVDLLDLGVLVEEWRGVRCAVRFVFDRLLEHLLAEHHDPRVDTPAAVTELARRAGGWRPLRGALTTLLRRACARERWELLTEPIDASGEGRRESDPGPILVAALREVLVQLGRTNDPALAPLLHQMRLVGGEADCRALCGAFDELLDLGHVASATIVGEAAVREAADLGLPKWRAAAGLRWGRLLAGRGSFADAETALREAESWSRAAGDDRLRCALLCALGRSADDRGRPDETDACYAEAERLAGEAGDRELEGEVLRCRGTAALGRGQLAAAEGAFSRALTAAEAARSEQIAGAALHGLARVAHDRGDLDAAERFYRRSLDVVERLGSRAATSKAIHNLGLIAHSRGDLSTAEQLIRRSLEIEEALGNRTGAGMALHNLAFVARDRGDFGGAEALLRRSLQIDEELGRPAGVSASLHSLGGLARDRGDLVEAERLFRRSLEIDERLGRQSGVGVSLNNLGRIARLRGDLTTAAELSSRARDIASELGVTENVGWALMNLGAVERERGDLTAARATLNAALATLEQTSEVLPIGLTLVMIANLALDGDQPLETLLRARELLRVVSTPRFRALLSALELRVAARSGNALHGPLAELEAAYRAWPALPFEDESPLVALHEAARHAAARGEVEVAKELAGRALAWLERLPVKGVKVASRRAELSSIAGAGVLVASPAASS